MWVLVLNGVGGRQRREEQERRERAREARQQGLEELVKNTWWREGMLQKREDALLPPMRKRENTAPLLILLDSREHHQLSVWGGDKPTTP